MFDTRLHDHWDPPDSPRSQSLIADICGAARAENRAAARRLGLIGELFEMRRAERGEEEHWAVDTWAAVGAEIAAALRISLGKAGSYMNYALAMRRLPAVAAVFGAGDIDMQSFQAIVYRTDLVTDEAARATIDANIAAWAARWPSMSRGRLTREIDGIVAAHDPDAVRRTEERARDRDVTIWDAGNGSADLSARLFATDAHLVDKRLDELAATVCAADPRTLANRRADALGALAAGADRLACRCGAAQCPAAAATAHSGVVIHVVADKSTLDGESGKPAYLLGTGTLIPATVLRELAATAKLRPLLVPAPDGAAECSYRPSRGLADFVRARDLTCRAPGCDRPAMECDLDHTIPYPRGATHASNIKALCRFHHLLKTFWGWQDRQLADGTVIWTLPGGRIYVTIPGSALLFPVLMTPTGTPPEPSAHPSPSTGTRTAMMPLRQSTRAANRAQRIGAERARNRRIRIGARSSANPNPEADDPPF